MAQRNTRPRPDTGALRTGKGRFTTYIGLLAGALALSGCASLTGGSSYSGSGGMLPEGSSLYGNYLAGRHAGLSRNTQDAAEYFSRALSKDPQNQTILERAFLLSLTAGQQEETTALAKRIVRLRPEDRLARLSLSIDAMNRRDYDAVLTHLSNAGNGPLTEIVHSLLRTWAFAGGGETEAAVAELLRLGPETDLELFRSYHRGLIQDLANNPAKAEIEYRNALALSGGKSHRIVQAYGRFLQRRNRVEDARSLYREFLTALPGHPIVEKELFRAGGNRSVARLVPDAKAGAAEALYGLASALAQDQNRLSDLPIVYLRLAIWLREDLNIARTLLADQLERTERPEAATEVYARIEKSSPLWIASRIRIARSFQRMKRSDEARAILEEVVALDARNTDVIATIGDILHSQKQYQDAARVYSRALATIDTPEAHHWTLYYRYGVVSERVGDWEQAEASLKKALELSPENPAVLNDLGYFWIDRKQNISKAMDMVRQAVEKMPGRAEFIDSLGWAHYRLGEYEEAVEYLEQAIALLPGNAVINDHLGDAYWKVGRKLEARFQWQHALANDPDEKEIPKIQRKITWGLDANDKTMAAADES